MLNGSDVLSQPVFLVFIFATILLSLGYFRGRRRNQRIVATALKGLEAVFDPKDQQFTNIGGLTGYHANIVPKKNRYVRRVDATITLLPRHSWLYLPISRVIRRFDRMFMVWHLTDKCTKAMAEGHLIEAGYSKFAGARILNIDSLEQETFIWGGKTFFLYSQTPAIRDTLLICKEKLGEPGSVRHIALVPEQERVFVFMIPRLGTVQPTVQTIFDWFVAFMEKATR